MNGNRRWFLPIAAALALIFVFTACTAATPSQTTAPAAATTAPAASTPSGTASANPADKTFTAAELAKYDGQNGNPAYIAVNGVVYDVSNVPQWQGGMHNGHKAGTDLTKAIASAPHGTRVLSGLPIVGKYIG